MTKWTIARKSLFICTVIGVLGMAFPDFRKDLFYIKDNAGLFDFLPEATGISGNAAVIGFMCMAVFGSLGLLFWHTGKN